MENLDLLYSLSQSEWTTLLGELPDMWLSGMSVEKLPKSGDLCGNTFDLKLVNKLYGRGILTEKGLYTTRGVEFLEWLYSYHDKRFPLPVVKDLLPRARLSMGDRETSFNRITNALKSVVSADTMRSVLMNVLVAEDGLVATNGYILFFIGYNTGHESHLYDPVVRRRAAYEPAQYPKWRSIAWDTGQAKQQYNVLVLETYSKLKVLVRLFPDANWGRNIFIGNCRISLNYLTRIFKIFYKFGVTACDIYLQGDRDMAIILKGATKGFEFLALVMPIRYDKDDIIDSDYNFDDLVVEQESVGFLGMV